MNDDASRHYVANCWCPISEHPRSGLPTPLELTYGIPPRGGLDREIDRARYSEARRRGGVAPWEAGG